MTACRFALCTVLSFGILTLAACGGGGGGDSAPPTSRDVAPPVFSSMTPPNLSPNVSLNTSIALTFNENLQCATATGDGVTLREGASGPLVPGSVTCSGATVTFDPTDPLAPLQKYTLRLTDIADLAGNVMTSPVVKSFTTGGASDFTAPTVAGTSPDANATGVNLDVVIAATLDEALDPATVSAANFTLQNGTTAIPAQVSYLAGAFSAELRPNSQLATDTTYTATLSTAVRDLAGNPLASPYSWSFTTVATDSSPPTLIGTTPAANEAYANSQTPVTAVFNEELDPATIDASAFILQAGEVAVAGTVSLNGTRIVFTPNSPLAAGAYTATLAADIADKAGNARTAPHVWNFTVSAPVLTGSPRFSVSNAQEDDTLEIAVPVSSNVHTVLVCLAPKPAVSSALALQVSTAALEPNGCSDSIVIDAGQTEVIVPITVQADAIWGDYYPTIVLKEQGAASPLSNFYESGSSPTYYYNVSTKSMTDIVMPLLAIGPAADLRMSIDSVVRNGTSLSVGYTVQNLGQGSARPSAVAFFVDPTSIPALGQGGNLTADLPSLSTGQTYTGSVIISGIASDPRLLYALVDSAGSVAESNETNNLVTWVDLDRPVETHTSTDVALFIPSAGSVTSALQVAGAIDPLRNIAVDLGIDHTFDEDLVITLTSPAGTNVLLVDQRGGGGDNFTGTIFHDGAVQSVAGGSAPFTGEFRPEEPLSNVFGENPNGTWLLRIEDRNPMDDGTLNGWELHLW
ncbi:MAG: Ig-like domain-containing protein [Desulfuromonadales bacterium]